MACPYFCPTGKAEGFTWRSKIRPPLGDAHQGECHVQPAQIHQPALEAIETCNLGYAAGRCSRFPANEGPDAVRFCIQADDGVAVSIDYVLERRHLPDSHGRVVYDCGLQVFSGVDDGSLLQSQARAYVQSYLRWKQSGGVKTQKKVAAAKG